MSDKELYCYRILKSYSLIVDFDGEVDRSNVPAPVADETFKQWKKRVLGEGVENVMVFTPFSPAPNQKMHRLQKQTQAAHLERIFNALNKKTNAQKKVEIKEAVQETEQKFSRLSKAVLADILANADPALEPSVKQFFERFEKSADDDIDVETLLSELVKKYNNLVQQYRCPQ